MSIQKQLEKSVQEGLQPVIVPYPDPITALHDMQYPDCSLKPSLERWRSTGVNGPCTPFQQSRSDIQCLRLLPVRSWMQITSWKTSQSVISRSVITFCCNEAR